MARSGTPLGPLIGISLTEALTLIFLAGPNFLPGPLPWYAYQTPTTPIQTNTLSYFPGSPPPVKHSQWPTKHRKCRL